MAVTRRHEQLGRHYACALNGYRGTRQRCTQKKVLPRAACVAQFYQRIVRNSWRSLASSANNCTRLPLRTGAQLRRLVDETPLHYTKKTEMTTSA
eukprot:1568302-Amphidinium_carterae.1